MEDFPKHYRANAAVFTCKLKKYEVSCSQFEHVLVTLMQFISVASDNYSPAGHQKIWYELDLDYLWPPHKGRAIPLGEILLVLMSHSDYTKANLLYGVCENTSLITTYDEKWCYPCPNSKHILVC